MTIAPPCARTAEEIKGSAADSRLFDSGPESMTKRAWTNCLALMAEAGIPAGPGDGGCVCHWSFRRPGG